MSHLDTITVNQLAERSREQSVDVIDVRMPVEFQEVHATMAQNVPLDTLDPAAVLNQHASSADDPLYVICQSGQRSRIACEKFIAAGFPHVVSVEGGTRSWDAAGLPVVRGKKSVSLERQVRIAAGFLVLLGVALGWLVHPSLFGLSAFVGAGLMFAGITDTCGMALLLARMPWNQTGKCES